MFRYGPRFGMPIDPYMAPPMADVQFRGGPQHGPLSQNNGGSMASGTMQGPQQPGGGGLGLGDAAGAAGLLSKLGGPQATSVMDPGFIADAASWGSGAPTMGGLLGTASMGPEGVGNLALASGGADLGLGSVAGPAGMSVGLLDAITGGGIMNTLGKILPWNW